jgi:hypothetical protein
MILRAMVLLLMMLNLGYLAWGQGWLRPYVAGPATQREPQRLANQLHPEAIRLVGAEELSRLLAESRAAKSECLQSDVLDAAQASKLRTLLLNTLPPQAWTMDEVAPAARWIVYMGKYANAAEADKKRVELARLGVTGLAPRSSALKPGIALATFDSQPQAETALKAFTERGVRTAHLVQDLPADAGFRLRLPAVDEALKAQLPEVRAALPGQVLQPCAAPS